MPGFLWVSLWEIMLIYPRSWRLFEILDGKRVNTNLRYGYNTTLNESTELALPGKDLKTGNSDVKDLRELASCRCAQVAPTIKEEE